MMPTTIDVATPPVQLQGSSESALQWSGSENWEENADFEMDEGLLFCH